MYTVVECSNDWAVMGTKQKEHNQMVIINERKLYNGIRNDKPDFGECLSEIGEITQF